MRVDLAAGHDAKWVLSLVRTAFEPGRIHEHVGLIGPESSLQRRAALAAAARSRGETASVDEEIREIRKTIDETPEIPDRREARRRIAETGSELERLRERVATLRGRMQADENAELEADYREEIRELSRVETEHAAARERLADARQSARAVRDERERRLGRSDRLGNLERAARAELAASVRPIVDRTVRDVPGSDAVELSEADDVTAALAVAGVASLEAPVVLECGRFPDAASAGAWLGVSVLRL